MSAELEQFHIEFLNEVRASADAGGQFAETAFFERFCEWLIESGEISTYDVAQYRAARGMRVDGYAGDPSESEGVLTLFIVDFYQDTAPASLTRTDVSALFKRVENFLRKALSAEIQEMLEESSPGYGLADLIHLRKNIITKVRLFAISNRILSARVASLDSGEIDGIPVHYNVWDISRLHRLVSSKTRREDIEINFSSDFGQNLPCLPAHLGKGEYQSFLAVVPGLLLARIYERWGAQLLEQNVRSFLQVKGSVNKGIRLTILNDPDMFFAYNNGLSATAEQVEVVNNGGASYISRLHNLQIVNGGQTTASIFSAYRKDKAELEHVFVQMKLTVVPQERVVDVVPRISEYANSQNRVSKADFFANHPFHVQMQKFSRAVLAPASDGSFVQTKWFYERARGQYLDAKAYLTESKKKAFEKEFPKNQCFSKTDLAKYEMVWHGQPHIVSKGAQHNFIAFAEHVSAEWDKDQDQFNELYFKRSVSKAIIFRDLEKLIQKKPWYGGYRANIVAYTLAKLAEIAKSRKAAVNFDSVWERQAIPDELAIALDVIAEQVQKVITVPEGGMTNISEWAKKVRCWQVVQALDITLPASFRATLLDLSDERVVKLDAKRAQRTDNGIDAQVRATQLSASGVWLKASLWHSTRRLLSPEEQRLLAIAATTPRFIPTEKQSVGLLKVLSKLQEAGFAPHAA